MILAGRRREHAHPLGLAPRLLVRPLGQLRVVDALDEVRGFLLPRLDVAQLGLDRAQLLAQVELALVLLDLHLRLALHVLHDLGPLELAVQPVEDEADPLADVQPLQHLVLVGDAEVHVRRREVGEAARIGDVHLEDLRHLVGNAVDEVGQLLGRRDGARDEVVEVVRVARRLARRRDADDRVGLRLLDPLDDDPPQPLEGDLDRVAGEVYALVHARRHADLAGEARRIGRVVVLPVGHHERHDQPRFLLVGPQQGEILGSSHLHGDRPQRVDDGRAECHEREARRELGSEDFVLTLSAGHVRACRRNGTSGLGAEAVGPVPARGVPRPMLGMLAPGAAESQQLSGPDVRPLASHGRLRYLPRLCSTS